MASVDRSLTKLIDAQATLITKSRSSPISALSLRFFCLPPYFLIVFFPFAQSQPAVTLLLLALLFAVVSGFATITYATHRSFVGTPLTLSSSLNSIPHHFLPVLLTAISGLLEIILFTAIVTFPTTLAVKFLLRLVQIDHGYITTAPIFWGIALIRMVYLLPRWGLATSIAVFESQYGFTTLRRSNYLLKWLRSESRALLFYSSPVLLSYIISSAVSWMLSPLSPLLHARPDLFDGGRGVFAYCVVVVVAAMNAHFSAKLMAYYVVGNALLYRYCKVLRGEARSETTRGHRAFRHCCRCKRLWLLGETVNHCGIIDEGGAVQAEEGYGRCCALQGLKLIFQPV